MPVACTTWDAMIIATAVRGSGQADAGQRRMVDRQLRLGLAVPAVADEFGHHPQ